MLDRMREIAEDLNSPVFRWLGLSFHCCRMTVSATGDEVESMATTAFDMGQEAAQPDALVWFAAQFFAARWVQGRVGEILDLVRQQVADNPGIPGWIGVLALSLAAMVAQLPADLGPLYPDDLIWLVGHSLLSAAVAMVGSPAQAATYVDVLEPFAGRCPCNGVIVRPAIDHNLAMLSARAGWPDKAEHYFAEAHARHILMGSPIWQAHTELEWGSFLLERGEIERARHLLTQAADRARGLGAMDVVAGAMVALDTLD